MPKLPQPPPGDAEWVRRLKAGDATAFDDVYAHHHGAVYGFLVRLLGRRDVSLAEDLAQETWVRLANHAVFLRDDTRLLPWLFTVARNLSVSFLRWRVLDRQRVDMLRGHPPADTETPFDRTAARQLARHAEAALVGLPVRHREPLLLCGVHGLSPQDAASVLRLRPDVLRQRLVRARAAFHSALASEAAVTNKNQASQGKAGKR